MDVTYEDVEQRLTSLVELAVGDPVKVILDRHGRYAIAMIVVVENDNIVIQMRSPAIPSDECGGNQNLLIWILQKSIDKSSEAQRSV